MGAVDIGEPFAYKPSSALLTGDSIEEETDMKSKKAAKRLRGSKKLEATKPLKVSVSDFGVTKATDKAS